MTDDATWTASYARRGPPPGRMPVAIVAHHPRPAHVGTVVHLPDGERVLGRGGDGLAPVPLDDGWMSRRHARLTVRGGSVVLDDLDSRNGTFRNGHGIVRAELQDGDVVRHGEIIWVLRRVDVARWPLADDIVGVGPAAGALVEAVEAVAVRDTTVLLLGPPGVGKGVVARALHARSGRQGPLVTFDCGAAAEGVVQSELFGHAQGAFSGAGSARRGLIGEAEGGTLLLDEIGDASPRLQASLLRLLEEREIRPVGADRARRVDVRIVAATNRDLEVEVAEGRFRHDLLTRLQRWVIPVPPLASRREDVGLLAHRFAARHAGRPMRLDALLAEALSLRDWPGNVRELDAEIERLVVTAVGDVLSAPNRDPAVVATSVTVAPTSVTVAPTSVGVEPTSGARPPGRPTREALVAELRGHALNVTHTAAALGVSRQTLYRWIRELDIALDALRA